MYWLLLCRHESTKWYTFFWGMWVTNRLSGGFTCMQYLLWQLSFLTVKRAGCIYKATLLYRQVKWCNQQSGYNICYAVTGLPMYACLEIYIHTAQLVYYGRMGASHFTHRGGGGNFICMPEENPEYLNYAPSVNGYSYVFGTEYDAPHNGAPFRHLHQQYAPCSLCFVPSKGTVAMIPAKTSCPSGWRKEYAGYLMASYRGTGRGRTTFECIDQNPQTVPGQAADTDGARIHHVEASCNGMPCPPYDPQKELTCAVCSK